MVVNHDFYLVKNKFSEIKKELQKEIGNNQIYSDFIKPLLLYDLENDTLTLIAPNEFVKSTVINNYQEEFTSTLNKMLHSNFKLCFATSEEVAARESKKQTTPVKKSNFLNNSNINTRYLFENFVVSPFNKTAYDGVSTVIKSGKYNPIFICGGVGLGKTHLLNALGNEYQKIKPQANVRYITSDDFVREVYKALSSGNRKDIEELKDQYQSCDLLLFDDVQFLSNKEKINEIFFNIFNYAINHNKFIVMTSDKNPNQLENFENRLKSRFSSGLLIQINKPSLESVSEILEYKIKANNIPFIFTKESIMYIARRNQNDIRKLEGYLNQVLFYADNNLQNGAIITPSIIQKATEMSQLDEFEDRGFDIDPNIVIDQVCLAYGISPKVVKSKSRRKDVSTARQVCIYVLRKKFDMTFQQMGKFFSDRNHSTILESYTKMEQVINKDENLKNFVEKIYKTI